MAKKIKFVKKLTDNHVEGESIRAFLRDHVKIKKEDYVLAGDEEECTTLQLLRTAKNIGRIDRKAFRAGLQRLDEIKPTENMTPDEKQAVGVTFSFANPADLFAEFPDVRDRINNGMSDFHTPAVESRKKRFRYASSIIYNVVNPLSVPAIINIFITPVTAGSISLWTGYTEFGLEGTAFGDSEGVMDYIRSVTGTTWANNGLREAIEGNMQPVAGNLTVDQAIAAIETALIDGIFEIP